MACHPEMFHQCRRSSTIRRSLFIERRLAAFVRQLGRGLGYLGAQLAQHGFGPPPQAKVFDRQCAQASRSDASASRRRCRHQCIDILPAHQLALLLHQAHLQHLGLDPDVVSVCLRTRRLLPLAPQVSEVGNAALIEREAVTLPLDHAFGFELADVGPAAIEMQRQCRRADGRCLSGREAGLATDGRSTVPVSVIVFIPVP
jgi:hypothetical protein